MQYNKFQAFNYTIRKIPAYGNMKIEIEIGTNLNNRFTTACLVIGMQY